MLDQCIFYLWILIKGMYSFSSFSFFFGLWDGKMMEMHLPAACFE